MYGKWAWKGDLHIPKWGCVRLIANVRLKFNWCLMLIGLSLASSAWAGIEYDPTEPAPAWLALQPVAPGKIATAPVAAMEVQVVIIGRSKNLAVIDGQIVKVGDEHGGSKVVAVRAGEIVKEDTAKSLLTMPAVAKQAPVTVYTQKKKVLVTPISDDATKAAGTGK